MEDFWSYDPYARTNFYDYLYPDYDFVDGVPSQMLFIRLSEGISDQNRQFVANGLRAYFRD
jgi:hypothetical protein